MLLMLEEDEVGAEVEEDEVVVEVEEEWILFFSFVSEKCNAGEEVPCSNLFRVVK